MRAYVILAVVGVITSFLGGCQPDPRPRAEDFITIGVIVPAGDPLAAGEDFQAGVELALSIVNDKVDLPLPLGPAVGLPRHGGLKLRAVYRQPEAGTAAAAAALEDLAMVSRVKAVLSGLPDDATLTVSERAERMGIPFLSCLATASRLTQRRLQWFFRLNPDDTLMVDAYLAQWQDSLAPPGQPGPHRLTLIHDKGLRGVGVARAVRQAAGLYGFHLSTEIVYDAAETSLTPLALANRRFLHDEIIVLQADRVEQANLWLQTWRSLGIRPRAVLTLPFSGSLSAFLHNTSGLNLVYLQFLTAPAVSAANPLQTWTAYLYRQRFGRELSATAALALTGTLVVAEALNQAPQLQPRSVRQALLQTDIPGDRLLLPWSGVRFDQQTGQNILARAFIGQVREGSLHLLWPRPEAAAAVNRPGQPVVAEDRP